MKASQCPQGMLETCGDSPHLALKLPMCICTPPVRSGSDGPGPSPFPAHPLTHWVGGQLRPSLYFPSHRCAPLRPPRTIMLCIGSHRQCAWQTSPRLPRTRSTLLIAPSPRATPVILSLQIDSHSSSLCRSGLAWLRFVPWRCSSSQRERVVGLPGPSHPHVDCFSNWSRDQREPWTWCCPLFGL